MLATMQADRMAALLGAVPGWSALVGEPDRAVAGLSRSAAALERPHQPDCGSRSRTDCYAPLRRVALCRPHPPGVRGLGTARGRRHHAGRPGSGAGFPGIPIKLFAPEVHLTLIESQNKKATFLREIIRTLRIEGAEVYANRGEHFGQTSNVVTMRAAERFESTLRNTPQSSGYARVAVPTAGCVATR